MSDGVPAGGVKIEFTSEEIGRLVKAVQFAAATFTKYGMPPEGDTKDMIEAGQINEFMQFALTLAALTRKYDELARKQGRDDLVELIRLFLMTDDEDKELAALDAVFVRCNELAETVRGVFVVDKDAQTMFDNGSEVVRQRCDQGEQRKLTRLAIMILMKVYFSKA